MRLKWRFLWLAIAALLALFGAGCAGINTTQSISPLDFLLPGMGHFLKADPPATNAPVLFSEISTEVVSIK